MKKRVRKPLWIDVAADILLTALLLLVFAYFDHVKPAALENENVVISRPSQTATAVPTATPVPAITLNAETAEATAAPVLTATPVPEPDPEGCFAQKYADRFTDGEVIKTDEDGVYTYKSANLNVEITRRTTETMSGTCVYYLTDFYVRDISCLTTVFAGNTFTSGNYTWLSTLSNEAGAVVAVNGDFCTMRKYGVVIRNGMLYRSKKSTFDACVIYWNGEMETFAAGDWDANEMVAKGAYQAWSFGPRLLDYDGSTMTAFNTTDAVKERNPRTAIGYYEPGHYCFVTADGRSNTSKGLSLSDLSKLMKSLGCKAAYNLDGGQSTSITWFGEVINNPYNGGRKIADAVLLVDEVLR